MSNIIEKCVINNKTGEIDEQQQIARVNLTLLKTLKRIMSETSYGEIGIEVRLVKAASKDRSSLVNLTIKSGTHYTFILSVEETIKMLEKDEERLKVTIRQSENLLLM